MRVPDVARDPEEKNDHEEHRNCRASRGHGVSGGHRRSVRRRRHPASGLAVIGHVARGFILGRRARREQQRSSEMTNRGRR